MSAIEVNIWLVTLSACILGTLSIAAFLRWGNPKSRWMLVAAVPSGMVWVLLAAMAPDSMFASGPKSTLLMKHSALCLAALAAAIQAGALQKLRYQAPGRGLSRGWRAFLACQFASVIAATMIFCYVIAPVGAGGFMVDGWAELVEDPGVVVLTDQGRRVPVFRVADQQQNLSGIDNPALNFQTALIRQSEPDLSSNCHGWVFTNGHHLLRGDAIDVILRDNDYQMVDHPLMGDVIIYRDLLGRIVHTGLVRAVSDDGLVLIESKWGIGGRFIHRPKDQFYSDIYRYYRTSRGSHLIAGLPVRGDGSTAASRRGPSQGSAPAG